MAKQILIIDDHVLIRASLTGLLNDIFYSPVIHEASDSSEAILLANSKAIDIVILDLMIPGIHGLLLLPRLKKALPDAEYVIVTGKNIESEGELLFEHGVAGIISKSCGLEAIRSALVLYLIKDQNKKLSGLPVGHGGGEQDKERFEYEAFHSLTKRQIQILALISEGLSNKEIARRLFLAEGTVKNHISTILAQLGVKNRTQAVFFAKKYKTDL